ncbi:hypothetical protein DL765_007514 [Monosporascus sp. GIB2]|nr:hypothetical protein DL765_007514 [Monosporascus sp. GIB2]
MPLGHTTHSLAEAVVLGDRTYFFDRENAVWSLATLARRLSPSSRASSPAWLRHSHGIGDATSSWKEIEPLTVVEILVTGDELGGERRVTFEELQGLFEKWRLTDDVWENGFLKRKLNHLSVAVPSRLQSQPTTPERPLAGLRFSVKDIFYIKGLGSPSLGSRAWVSIRDKQYLERQQDQEASNNELEGIVEVLQRMGAVLVGKNKLSEFAFAGPYHWQNTDYLLNFNPRADGLQTPLDSSGGSASAVAAYDWLDFAIGTDTGGSVRLPADANGVYGGRPTTGAIDTSSMQSLSKSLDTVVNNNAKAAWKTIEAGGISESMYREAIAKRDMLKCWVNTYLTEEYSPISTLLVSRGSNQGEELRDTQSDERYFAPSQPGRILSYTHLNTLADLPDHRLPIGQFEGRSSVTGHTEIYPLTASLTVASAGGERILLKLIEHLHREAALETVQTGRTAF